MSRQPAPRANLFAATHKSNLWRELPLLLVAPLVLYLLACLISYSPDDPSASNAGSLTGPLHNFGGVAGAWIADLAFQLAGYVAYLLPVILAGVTWVAIHGRDGESGERLTPAWRLSGLVLLLLAAPGLAQVQWGAVSGLPAGAGGVIGQLIGGGLSDAFGQVGANLFLFGLFLVAVTVATGLSWFAVMDRLGIATIWLAQESLRGLRALHAWRLAKVVATWMFSLV